MWSLCCCCCSVAKSRLTLRDPWTAACPAPLSPSISQSLLKLCPLSQWCSLTILSSATPFSFCFHSFSASGSFPMSQLFKSGGQSIAASTSVLPINIQGWFPLGLIGLISLLSKGLSRVFSSTTVLSPWPSKMPEEEVLDLLTKILVSFHGHPVGLWQKPYGPVFDLRVLSRNLVGGVPAFQGSTTYSSSWTSRDVGMIILAGKSYGYAAAVFGCKLFCLFLLCDLSNCLPSPCTIFPTCRWSLKVFWEHKVLWLFSFLLAGKGQKSTSFHIVAIQGVILSHVRVFQTLVRIHPSPALSGTCEARAAAKPTGAGLLPST